MKLKNIFIPLATVATTAAAIVPLTTACGSNGRKTLPKGYTNAKSKIDTSKFEKVALPTKWEEEVYDYTLFGKGTESYINAIKDNSKIVKDDYAYHLTKLNGMMNQLKDLVVIGYPIIPPENVDPEPVEYKSPITDVKVNTYGGKISNLAFGPKEKIKMCLPIIGDTLTDEIIYPTSWNKSIVLSADFTANFDDLYEQITETELGWGEIQISVDLGLNLGFLNCPVSIAWDPISVFEKMFETKKVDLTTMPSPTEYVYGLGFILDFMLLLGTKEVGGSSLAYTDWQITANFDINITIKTDFGTFNIGGGKKQNATVNYKRLEKSTIAEELAQIGTFAGIIAGWTTYYYSDYIYEPKTL